MTLKTKDLERIAKGEAMAELARADWSSKHGDWTEDEKTEDIEKWLGLTWAQAAEVLKLWEDRESKT